MSVWDLHSRRVLRGRNGSGDSSHSLWLWGNIWKLDSSEPHFQLPKRIRLLWSVCHHGSKLEFDSAPASSVKSVHSAQSDSSVSQSRVSRRSALKSKCCQLKRQMVVFTSAVYYSRLGWNHTESIIENYIIIFIHVTYTTDLTHVKNVMYTLTLDCQALGKHPCIIWLRLSFTIKNIPKHHGITIVYLQSSCVRNKSDLFFLSPTGCMKYYNTQLKNLKKYAYWT